MNAENVPFCYRARLFVMRGLWALLLLCAETSNIGSVIAGVIGFGYVSLRSDFKSALPRKQPKTFPALRLT